MLVLILICPVSLEYFRSGFSLLRKLDWFYNTTARSFETMLDILQFWTFFWCGIFLFNLYIKFSIFMRLEISAAKIAVEVRETFFCAAVIAQINRLNFNRRKAYMRANVISKKVKRCNSFKRIHLLKLDLADKRKIAHLRWPMTVTAITKRINVNK